MSKTIPGHINSKVVRSVVYNVCLVSETLLEPEWLLYCVQREESLAARSFTVNVTVNDRLSAAVAVAAASVGVGRRRRRCL